MTTLENLFDPKVEKKEPTKRNWVDLPTQMAIVQWIKASDSLRASKVPQIGDLAHPSGLTHYYQRWEDGLDDAAATEQFLADMAAKGLTFKVTVHNFSFVRRSYFGELTSHPSYREALVAAKQPKLDA